MIGFFFKTMRYAFGVLLMLIGLLFVSFYPMIGIVSIGLGYFLFNGYDQLKRNKIKSFVKSKLGDDAINVLVAAYEDDPYKTGYLALTKNHIAYVRGSKIFAFGHNEIQTVGFGSQGTGSYIGGYQKIGNVAIGSMREVGEKTIYIKGISNGEAFSHTWGAKEHMFPSKKAAKFYEALCGLEFYQKQSQGLDSHQIL